MRTISQKLGRFFIVKIFNIIKFFKTFSLNKKMIIPKIKTTI